MSSRIGKIQVAYGNTGRILYGLVRNAIAEAWNVGGAAWEAFNVANWPQYAVAMTEQGALSSYYVGDLPAGAEAYYTITVYEQVGIGPVAGDPEIDFIRAAQLADDVPHGGVTRSSTATMALKQAVILCPDDDAFTCQSQAAFGRGMALTGGVNGPGMAITCGGAGEFGLIVDGVHISPPNGPDDASLRVDGSTGGSWPAVYINGMGLPALCVDSNGDYDVLTMNNAYGFLLIGELGAIRALNLGNAPVAQLGDGANGGIGLEILAGVGSGTGAAGVNIVGNLQGDGVDIAGGATDATGLLIAKGGTLGNALEISGGQHAILLETINSSVILANGNNTFMTANLVGGDEYLRVNGDVAIDNVGRHRLWSSLTFDDVLLAFPFLMTDLAGNPMTGLAVTSTVILDGSPPVPTANSPVEVGNGIYTIDLAASDRAGTTMMLRLTAPNARDLDIAIINTA